MPVLGITGSIATGKSTFTRALRTRLPAHCFDADQAARRLLESDAATRRAVAEKFGPDIYPADGAPDRARLREVVFASADRRAELEAILHPGVRTQWVAKAETARLRREWLLIDIPLLYETGAESHLDRVIVVACSPATQRERLLTQRGLSPELATQIIAAQLDLPTKIKRADHLIWNDSGIDSLDAQTDLLAGWLTQHYG